jgi:uncharacterized protein YecT (DUF1311 family)
MNKYLTIISFFICTLCISQTQNEMNQEAYASYQKADKELNTVYKKILNEYKADTEFIKNLKTAQRIWITFRDAEMKMKYPDRGDYYYGSIHPMCLSGFLEELTRERIKTLNVWLEGIPEGDACLGSVKMIPFQELINKK